MIRRTVIAGATCVALGSVVIAAQTKSGSTSAGPAAREQPPGESAAPDGYAPVPQWLGQTRAPVPAKTEAFTVETVASGLTGANFRFLPDGRIIVAERDGRIRLVGKDGTLSAPLAGMPSNMFATGQSLFDVQPDRSFASNRTIYFTYAVLPAGVESGHATLARARACRQRDDLGRRHAP